MLRLRYTNQGGAFILVEFKWRFADAWSKRTLLVGALWDRNSLDRMYSNIYFTGPELEIRASSQIS